MADWNEGICNEKAGFLFSHACDRIPEGRCGRCSKPICSKHTRDTSDGAVCTSCGKKKRRSRSADYYDDPYYYGHHYYHGYGYYRSGWGSSHYAEAHGYDPQDFTEADAESLGHSGDEGFESDMMES